ncbi:MAG: 5-methyltetrahydropteroyltriglutamate--homocysteine methyltransferase, partial [Butyricicoccus sp.]|nr:5-methyltetrahydropteroyltriglutamate--homocysteine methyltransferase [Butyricicoccus sp.]
MSNLKTPFRYDFVGSFLRPQALKDAKAAYNDGKITKEELDRVTDEEITKVVAKQKKLGFHAITDGEFRR